MIMKLKTRIFALSTMVCGLITLALTAWALPLTEMQINDGDSSQLRSSLPVKSQARLLLDNMLNHHHWMPVEIEASKSVLAWMVHPMRADSAPVILLKSTTAETSDWLRAIGDQLAMEGYLVIVPEVLTEVDQFGNISQASVAGVTSEEIAQRESATLAALAGHAPAMNSHEQMVVGAHSHNAEANSAHAMTGAEVYNPHHHSASIDHTRPVTELIVDERSNRVSVAVNGSNISFDLTQSEWPVLVKYINEQTGNAPVFPSFSVNGQTGSLMGQVAVNSTFVAGSTAYQIGVKDPRLPADYYTAEETLLNSNLRSEWVDIPLEGSTTDLHTFIVYPEGDEPTGVVIVMHHGVGLDTWQRALAHQIAEDGFIAVAADTWSGTAPDGGNWDASEFIDDAMRAAAGKISPEEAMRRYKAARDYALTLPRANGKTASVGFCMGGGFSFRFATEVPDLNGAVVFYGGAPDEMAMENIQAPVLGFYGENDARVTASVEPAQEAMARLGKYYEPHVYADTTHSFALFQQLGTNAAAIQDAWPRMISFFEENLL